MHLRQARVIGRSFAAGSHPPTHFSTVGACGETTRRAPPGGPAGGSVVAACLGRWRALPQWTTRREVQIHKPTRVTRVFQHHFLFRGLGCSRKMVAHHHHQSRTTTSHAPPVTRTHSSTFSLAAVSAGPPL
jgi:hypothetical protein